jgi:RHS repeat-associated protein
MVTDASGNLMARYDFLPFGDELGLGTAGRPSPWSAGADGIQPKFTGQEKDSTGLDFFQARYYDGVQGRFNSPDPANAGADATDPQTWNGYAYVRNAPLTYVDPDGLQTGVSFNGGPTDTGGGNALGALIQFLTFGAVSATATSWSFGGGPPEVWALGQPLVLQSNSTENNSKSSANKAKQQCNDANGISTSLR